LGPDAEKVEIENISASPQGRRAEFVDHFIERVLQVAPKAGENILRKMERELAEIAGDEP
jgi:hypothetical protein